MHRAIVSVIEELEAIDWYQQRADACSDDALRSILLHNKNEEVEHALMVMEWIRRGSPVLDEMARRYLFTEGPVVAIEDDDGSDVAAIADRSLGVGSLKDGKENR